MSERQRVVVVTGGGGGIGAAIACELGRAGWFVVTLDPMVTLDGSEQLPATSDTTAGRIVADGGSAKASTASVSDRDAVRELFEEVAAEHGGLDAVVNVAGITRQTYFGKGTEEDWVKLLDVHLGGYLNVLGAALPLMARAGFGRIVGVTSGSGWRAADAGAYSCAKRAVAALTWQLGRHAPDGVSVNAMSPIAATRMVAAAVERARQAGRTSGGGISLTSMPGPEDIAPFAAHLVSEEFGWCSGRVLFAGGPEVAVIEEPRLLEVVRTTYARSLRHVLDATIPRAFVPAEKKQSTDGGANPRFGPIFEDAPAAEGTPSGIGSCLIVSDMPEMTAALTSVLEARSTTCHQIDVAHGFAAAGEALAAMAKSAGPLDAVVVAPRRSPTDGHGSQEWERMLSEHSGIVDGIHSDASWARAVADYSAGSGRPVKLATLTDARDSAGRSRAQSAAQQARVATGATEGRVTAFAVSVEDPDTKNASSAAAELAAHLLEHPESGDLAGAELAVGAGWIGLRSHPRAGGSVVYGGPAVPSWLDGALREIAGARLQTRAHSETSKR